MKQNAAISAPKTEEPQPSPVVYVAPESDLLDRYANSVCQRLPQNGNQAVSHHDLVQGFSAFIKRVAMLSAKQCNQGVSPCHEM